MGPRGPALAKHQVPEDGDRVCTCLRVRVTRLWGDARCQSSRGFSSCFGNPSRVLHRCNGGAWGKILPDRRAVAGGVERAAVAGLLLATLPHPAPSVPRRVRAMCVAVSAVSS